ncbi:MAG: hypothetical protein K2P08_02520 [Oscillospiraceae bacterium]|nr:hypothetical protein [Oscillospiraceae bacterium]MDE7003285.1 hypothetical protein [Oscillospiraceae bacterium]
MAQCVILELPLALLLYGAALFFCLFERRYRATRGIFFLLSTALALGASAYALIWGAGLWETAAALLPFLLLNLGVGV